MKKLFLLILVIQFSIGCHKDIEDSISGKENLKLLYEAQYEPFNTIDKSTYELLMQNVVFDNKGEFRGIINAQGFLNELGNDDYQLMVGKLLEEIPDNTKLSEIKSGSFKENITHPVNDCTPIRRSNGIGIATPENGIIV